MKATVNNTLSNRARVFDGPATTAKLICALPNGFQGEFTPQPDGWAHVELLCAGKPMLDDNLAVITGHVNGNNNLIWDLPSPNFTINPSVGPVTQVFTLSWKIGDVNGVWLLKPDGILYPTSGTAPDGSAHVETYTALTAGTFDFTLRVLYRTGQYVDYKKTITAQVVVEPPLPPVPAAREAGIGVHTLTSVKGMQQAQAAGCRVYLLMNRPDEACGLATGDPRTWTADSAYPLVMYRIYHQSNPWSPQQMVDQLAGLTLNPNANKKNVVITLANEWDCGIPAAGNSAAGMSKFCDWTLECLRILNGMGFTNVAWLTSSVGTFEVNDQAICDVVKAKIAPLWNSGALLWTDMHLYSPTPAHIDAMDEWYEGRWRFLYTRCGFSPTAPGRIVSSEMGLDEGGIGGFPAHGFDPARVRDYCRKFLTYQAKPLVVNGVSYPSPFLAGAIFQCDPDDQQWQGYRVSSYYPLLWELA